MSSPGLTNAQPGPGERKVALAVVAVSIVTLGLIAPFARLPLPRVDAFIPIYESALAICDLITAVLLFGQFARTRSAALMALACGYLFDVLLIVPHAMSFPGVFAPQGLLGAGPQTTAWLYLFWHGGFALFLLAYALLAGRGPDLRDIRGKVVTAIAAGIVATVILVIGLTVLATAGHDLLTPVMRGADYSMVVSKGISPSICILSLIALALLWRRRNASVLDLWLIVVVCAWLCDVVLSGVVGSSRYDLGWYAGRSYGLLAASFLLVALLVELNKLYGDLAQALDTARASHLELTRSRERLAHAQRLEAMGQLTGGVAHDFNNLLTVITGSLDIILRSTGNAAKVERLARAALEGAARGQKLTQQLLTFARRQVSRPEVVNPNRQLSNFDGILRRAAGDGIEVVSKFSPVLDPARFDPTQFEAAILNLVVNARDAMPSGGRITIETSNVAINGKSSAAEDVDPGDYVLIAVTDTGTGMAPDVARKAFDPFFTTKDVGLGSGLGLSQVYGFATGVGGHVRLKTSPGAGTTVELYLPRSSGMPSRHARRSIVPVRAAQADESVLVVEDDAEVLSMAVEELEDLGYRVMQAANAAEALKLLRGESHIDVLFSDVVMPGGMNGVQLAVEARRIRPHLKVLLTSGYAAEALKLEHGLPDDLEMLGKPYRRDDLADKLRLVINN